MLKSNFSVKEAPEYYQYCDVMSYCASSFAIRKLKCIWSNHDSKPEKEKRWILKFFLHEFPF